MNEQWKSNYHTHCNYCDGNGTLKQFTEAAINAGLSDLGFSPHAPVTFDTGWTMKEEDLPNYLNDFGKLKSAYNTKINLHRGLEIDYIPGVVNPADFKKKYELDYTIGSVHFLGQLDDGEFWNVDGMLETFEAGLAYTFKGNIKNAVQTYYALIREMAGKYTPDIIGHLDLIAMHNRGNRFFSDKENWYKSAISDTIDVIADSGCIIEINTGGLTRGKHDEFYPARWIIDEILNRHIPVTIDSDAHKPEQINGYFIEALDFINKSGSCVITSVNNIKCLLFGA